MRGDLQELEITLGELKRLTTFKLKEIVVKGKKQIKETINISSILVRWLLRILGIIAIIAPFPLPTIIRLALIPIGIFLIIFSKKILKGNFSPFINEVNQHNQIILNIDILDQLEAVGNPVKLNEREKVIEALKINRENIVRALQTERILKENPQFRPEQFNIDLSGLRALQATEKATEYGQFLNEALQVGVSVQTEMRKLENKRLGL